MKERRKESAWIKTNESLVVVSPLLTITFSSSRKVESELWRPDPDREDNRKRVRRGKGGTRFS